jgi:hypothetical protein
MIRINSWIEVAYLGKQLVLNTLTLSEKFLVTSFVEAKVVSRYKQ